MSCLALANLEAFKIIEINASKIGYGGILKQKNGDKERLVRFTSGIGNQAQLNYSTIKKIVFKHCFIHFKISSWFFKSKVFGKNWLQINQIIFAKIY